LEQKSNTWKQTIHILYNKYRGIIRLFAFNGDRQSHTSAIVTINWFGSNTNSMLSNNFPNQENNEESCIVNYVTDFSPHSWFTTDFVVSFDPTTIIQNYYSLEVRISMRDVAEINLTGISKFETKSVSIPTNNKSTSPLKLSGQILKNLPDSKSISNIISSIKSLTGTNPKIGDAKANNRTIEQQNQTISDINNGKLTSVLSNVSTAVKSLGGTIGAIGNIFDLFIGKSSSVSKVELMPTVSEGSTKISGTITTITNGARLVLQLPGTNHEYNDHSLIKDGLPYFDQPLGVFCIEEEPVIDCKYAKDSYELRKKDKEYNHDYVYRSYRASGKIKLAINKSSGLEYVSGTAQLFTKSGIPTSKHESIYDPINDGVYETVYRNDSIKCYGSHPIPLEKFCNTVINTHLSSKIYLRLTFIFKVVDGGEDTPIVYSKVYKINAIDRNTKENAKSTDEYDFSPYQIKDSNLPSTDDTNALIVTYY